MIVPQPRKWIAGEEPDENTMNARCAEMVEFLLEPPQAMIHAVYQQSIANGTWQSIYMDVTDKDNDGIANLGYNWLAIQTPGWYEVVFGLTFASVNATYDPVDRRVSAIRVNGDQLPNGYRGRRDVCPSRAIAQLIRTGGTVTCLFLNAGDTVELMGYQGSGTTMYTYVADNLSLPFLQVRWVSN